MQSSFYCRIDRRTLERDRFVFYLQQDALYLIDFARAFAHTAAKLNSVTHVEDFLAFAHEVLIAERELHKQHFQLFEVQPNEHVQPACFNYTNYYWLLFLNVVLKRQWLHYYPVF